MMGGHDQELADQCHAAAKDAEPLLLQTNVGKPVNTIPDHHQHRPHCLGLLPTFFVKTPPVEGTSIANLIQLFANRKLILHAFTSLLLLGFLACNFNYLLFKVRLYYRELPAVLEAPWVLLILVCELFYFISTVISAVDYFVPPMIVKAPPPNLETILASSFYDYDLAASKRYPTVDVMIPCCKEPTDVPQESILAALALDYPNDRFKVLVLDDGADDDLKVFCETIQAESGSDQLVYLRRTKVAPT